MNAQGTETPVSKNVHLSGLYPLPKVGREERKAQFSLISPEIYGIRFIIELFIWLWEDLGITGGP